MATITVKAAEGRRVREPRTMQVIPEAGIMVDETDPYWVRRLRDGDVERVEAQDHQAKE